MYHINYVIFILVTVSKDHADHPWQKEALGRAVYNPSYGLLFGPLVSDG